MVESARERTERVSEAKTRFLAAASHDIRQPLQALGTTSDLLRQRLCERKELEELLNCQSEAVGSMRELLNTLLDVSRLDSGAVMPEIGSFPVAPLLERLGAQYLPVARDKGLKWRVVRSSAVIQSDPVLLRQILDNLVTNAVRYTSAGGVLVGCRRRGDALSIEVWDTGIGIPKVERERVFEDFYQLNNSERNANKGLGLGLVIVERTARLLGHRISVQTRENDTQFTVEVPLGAADALVKVVREAHYPDIIVTDFRLPGGKNDAEAVEAIRNTLGVKLPALILTGDIALSRASEAIANFCTVLQKPVDPENLNEQIHCLLA